MPPVQVPERASTYRSLRGMGLSKSQIMSVPRTHHRALLRHMAGGNRFTDFFTKTLKRGFENFGSKVKDAFSQKNIEDRFLNPLRDYVNPVLAKGLPMVLNNIPIPGIPQLGKAFGLLGDQYLKLMPPVNGPFAGKGLARSGGRRRGGSHGLQGGAVRGRHCLMCGSVGATAATCPLNPDAKHKRYSRHLNARR